METITGGGVDDVPTSQREGNTCGVEQDHEEGGESGVRPLTEDVSKKSESGKVEGVQKTKIRTREYVSGGNPKSGEREKRK